MFEKPWGLAPARLFCLWATSCLKGEAKSWVAVGGAALLLGAPAACAQAAASPCNFADTSQASHPPYQTVVRVVLSPRMPHALLEWPRMARVAQEAGLQILAFRDPRVPMAEWQDATRDSSLEPWRDLPALAADVAAACRMLNHAPTAVLERCSHVHPWPIWGVMPDLAWRHVLQARRADLEALPCP